jgi:hypothetical protein
MVRARAAKATNGGSTAAGASTSAGSDAEAGVEAGAGVSAGVGSDPRLIARDDRNNPLISIFDWTADARQRVFRVPAGFMRNKTQERIEEIAREREATTIDLTLVEEGIEAGKRMMAEMIATYTPPTSASANSATASASSSGSPSATPSAASGAAGGNGARGGGYLNEVSAQPGAARD